MFCLTTNGIRSFAINKSLEYSNNENELFMEFGVHEGKSINFFSKYLKEKNKKIYGFDSFQGQPDDWPGYIRTKRLSKT